MGHEVLVVSAGHEEGGSNPVHQNDVLASSGGGSLDGAGGGKSAEHEARMPAAATEKRECAGHDCRFNLNWRRGALSRKNKVSNQLFHRSKVSVQSRSKSKIAVA